MCLCIIDFFWSSYVIIYGYSAFLFVELLWPYPCVCNQRFFTFSSYIRFFCCSCFDLKALFNLFATPLGVTWIFWIWGHPFLLSPFFWGLGLLLNFCFRKYIICAFVAWYGYLYHMYYLCCIYLFFNLRALSACFELRQAMVGMWRVLTGILQNLYWSQVCPGFLLWFHQTFYELPLPLPWLMPLISPFQVGKITL